MSKIIGMNGKLLLDNREIIFLEGSLVNSQDAAILRMLVDGVTIVEMINLKKSDVDFEQSVLKLDDRNGQVAMLSVSKRCVNQIEDALNQVAYINDENMEKMYDLAQSEYVLRSEGEKITEQDVLNRIDKIEKIFLDI